MAAMVEEFRARRDLVVDGLNAIPGIRCLSPKGAFYAFPDIGGTGLGGKELADRLLLEAGVCVLAGTAFGGVATNHIRVSYANSRENLTKALGRIGEFVAGLPGSRDSVEAGAGAAR
jgi:aspartate/methionine/tyrosine aminotransferase